MAHHQLTEARETKLVSFAAEDDGRPTTRRAHFIKPVAKLPHQGAAGFCPPPPLPDCDRPPGAVLYKGWLRPPRRWAAWVEKMELLHGQEWDAAGIRGAIKASTLKIWGQPDLVSLLVQRLWCVETNTFVFPWGEVTPTLEDMAVLGGLPLLGEAAVRPEPLTDHLASLEDKMDWDRKALNSTASRKALHSGWLKLYLDWNGAGGDDQMEHVAFLSLWLSRFVFPGPSSNIIGPHVFPLAARLATGTRLALAPAVLASLYRDLRLIKELAARDHSTGDAVAVVWAPFQLLQMWFWERFSALKPWEGPRSLQPHEPWAARWHGLQATPPAPVRARDFRWRPYADGAEGWAPPPFYPDVGRWVDGSLEEDEAVRSFSRCLAPSLLMGFGCTELYLPHRVAMQLGYDQDIPGVLPNPNAYSDQPWFIYDKPLGEVRFYLPSKLTQAHYTTQYRRWRRNHHRISAPTASTASGEQVPGAPAEFVQLLPAPRHVPLQKETATRKSLLQAGSSSMHGMQCPPPEIPPEGTVPEQDLPAGNPTAEGVRESETNTAVAGSSTEVEPLAMVLVGGEEPLSMLPPPQKRKAEEQPEHHRGFTRASAQQVSPSDLSATTKKVRSSESYSPANSVMGSVGASSSNPLVIDDGDGGGGVDDGVTGGQTDAGEAGASTQETIREMSSRVGELAAEIAVLQEKLTRLTGRHP
ncbi:hypothetical protein Taro_048891 [Colocasia esculenta]|uniref:Aminotransferase-like plant mobile domain-containing protein n=1 Tax=Colocasia esculenta TaxID=4460 RepID=A0A843X9G2_COLES|nr:hypothetical protein [Colocasia esculenta]